MPWDGKKLDKTQLDEATEAIVHAYKTGFRKARGYRADDRVAEFLKQRGITTVEEAQALGIKEGIEHDEKNNSKVY